MCKLSLSLLLAIFGCLTANSLASVLPPAKDMQRDIIVVKDVHAFVAQHPGLRLQRMDRQSGAGQRVGNQSVRYTLGARISSDRLVAQAADVFEYNTRKDVSLQLTYPESGNGAIVTFVELICTQDNNEGNAYVVAGGIGQRFISIVVEAKQTQNFSYQAQYFGTE